MHHLSAAAFVCLLSAATLAAAQATSARIVIQDSPLAGFKYYEGKEFWDQLKVGDALRLVREPANPHDGNAIRVEWKERMLGYVPRRENAHLARQMDRGAAIEARITELHSRRNGRHSISYEIFVQLKSSH
ncbi:MAG: HIRAN domain-containing protein [Betaproteobacteria bacterium]|nr:HIRAN domain-containing protein [Betaproteobacteria bacterium]